MAFTLIELLVVLAIISILSAILIPAISGVRQSALAVESISNLREIGNATRSYLNANKMIYPHHYGKDTDGVYRPWMDALEPYLPDPDGQRGPATATRSNNSVFYCPAEENHNAWSDYGANMKIFKNGEGDNPLERINGYRVKEPADLVIVATVKHMGLSLPDGRGFWAFDGAAFLSNPDSGMRPYPRLNGRIGLLYADGHIESATEEELADREQIFSNSN